MATYYLSNTGNDSNSGDLTHPWLTFSRAFTTVAAGDILTVRAGTYATGIDTNVMPVPSGTSWADAPQVVAFAGETVTLGRLNLGGPSLHYFVVDGITFNGALNNEGVSFATDHLRLQNSIVRNAPGHGISITVADCEVLTTSCLNNGSAGVAIYAERTLIQGCTLSGNLEYGLQIYGGVGDARILRTCLIKDNNVGGAYLGWSDGALFYNNLVSTNGSGSPAIYIASSASNLGVYNNTVYGNGGNGIWVNPTTGVTIINNLCAFNGHTDIDDQSGGSATFLTNYSGDGHWVSPSTGDFHLQPDSPARDAGTTVPTVMTDFDGLLRPQEAAYDIGAYEYPGTAGLRVVVTPARQSWRVQGTARLAAVVQASTVLLGTRRRLLTPRTLLAPREALRSGHPLNKQVVGWWLTTPAVMRSFTWPELVTGRPAALINMGLTTRTSGWSATTRRGGLGTLNFDGVDDYAEVTQTTTLTPTTYTLSIWALWDQKRYTPA